MATIQLMRINSIPQLINKNITTVTSINGDFKQPFDLMSPTIRIELGNPTEPIGAKVRDGRINYIQFEDKYYYINGWEIENGVFITLKLKLDVLVTYKEEINKMNVMLERSSSSNNSFVVDNQLPLQVTTDITKDYFPKGFSQHEHDGTYIMVTSQSGYDIPKEVNNESF